MCTRPKLVDIGKYKALNNGFHKWNSSTFSQLKFCPCGMCIECRNMRREEYTQRLKHEIETSNYIASFVTLTYRDDTIPRLTDKPFKYINYSDNVDYDIVDKAIKDSKPNDIQKLLLVTRSVVFRLSMLLHYLKMMLKNFVITLLKDSVGNTVNYP